MHGLLMKPMQKRLNKAGWSVDTFSYSTSRESLDDNLKSLKEHVDQCNEKYIHFVGHSMGGLLIRCFFDRYDDHREGRIVSLGTPHQGASIARYLKHIGLEKLLGTSTEKGLIDKLPPWTHVNEFGSIAGTQNIGPRKLLNLENDKSDGTVLLEETLLEGQTDHISINTTHTLLIYSELACSNVDFFLHNGSFNRN